MSQNIKVQGLSKGDEPQSDRDAIRRLIQNFSFEMLPVEVAKSTSLPSVLPHTKIFIPRLPKGDFDSVVQASAKLRKMGFEPVPHLAARTIRNSDHLNEMLRQLTWEGSVREVLLIAGSQDQAEGTFENTLQLLETGLLDKYGIDRIGVAGHPEGHPQAGEQALQDALAAKNRYATQTGAHLYLVTQFFFDAAPVIAWERRIREAGNKLPVEVGLHGVTGIASLARHAAACGVGASMKILMRQSTNILQMAALRTPDRLLSEIANVAASDPQTLFRSVHFFPLGGLAKTIEWATAVSLGKFAVKGSGNLTIEV